ncbi:hypothetical protein [Belnapia rosea]|uniref:Uncharacterized protein n=1 Tax=Belnapia rosea TaxID=938405 RepID=A0A1G6L3Q5_9PROT|nr:hypothetical protein [Belnapia rosea]SDC37326.1 hypothetical protein SAMN04487779_1001732 [Belnapia rosea]
MNAMDSVRRSGWHSPWAPLLPAALLLLVSLAGLLVVGLLPAEGASQYAVLGPPWSRTGEMFALVDTAGGAVLDTGGWRNVVIAHSGDPGFASALYRAGAWLVLDAVTLRGCLGGLAS